MTSLPDLASLVRAAAREVSVADLPALGAVFREGELLVEMRLRSAVQSPNGNGHEAEDRNLDASEAARRLGMSRDWLYRNAGRLPFAVRIGSRVLFSAQGLERWNRSRSAR